jgi:hypothetical protein
MENKDHLNGYKIRWTQAYPLSNFELQVLARKMITELNENQMLEDSDYKEAITVINHIKSL